MHHKYLSITILSERFDQNIIAGKDVPEIYELIIVDKKGNELPVQVNAVAFEYEGKPADLVFLSDISRLKQAEFALRESEELLSDFINSAMDAFLIFDRHLNLIASNPPAEKILGYTTDDIGKNLLEIAPHLKGSKRFRV